MIMRYGVLPVCLRIREKGAFLNKNELWDLIRALAMIHWVTLGQLFQRSCCFLPANGYINYLPWPSPKLSLGYPTMNFKIQCKHHDKLCGVS